MSYLLTEIALEMLGYKFYDTNGVFHLTNFQQSMAAVQNDVHPDEPSLTEFIDQSSNSVTTQNGHTTNNATSSSGPSASMVPSTTSAISVDMRRTPIRALAKMMANEGEKRSMDTINSSQRNYLVLLRLCHLLGSQKCLQSPVVLQPRRWEGFWNMNALLFAVKSHNVWKQL